MFPEWGRFAVARGAAMFATRAPEAFTLAQLRETLATAKVVSGAADAAAAV